MNMHMQIIQLHIMSIHPANKAAEHLISSQLWLVSEKKAEVVNVYLIKNSKGEVEKKKKKKKSGGGGGGGGTGWSFMGV